jgi:hypothetical protein
MMGLLLGGALTSCGEVAVVAAMQFEMTATPAQLSVRQGEEGQLTVTVKRLLPGGVSPVPILVRLNGPPAGVSADPVTLGPGQSEAALKVRVTAGATPGGPVNLAVQGKAGLVTKTAAVALTVTP